MKEKTKVKSLWALVIIAIMALSSWMMLATTSTVNALGAESADLRFSLINNSTEYNVSTTNKLLVVAEIPAYYNGLPVTQVANNGFMSCSKLERVKLPYTMLKIGNGAFTKRNNVWSVDRSAKS